VTNEFLKSGCLRISGKEVGSALVKPSLMLIHALEMFFQKE
jgi:hypothetical protein